MKHENHYRYTFIMAAIAHAARVAHGPGSRKEAVVYYLKTLAADLQRKLQYDLASHARALLIDLNNYSGAFAVAHLYGATDAQLTQAVRPDPTPASNTGVNSSQLSILEDYLAYRG